MNSRALLCITVCLAFVSPAFSAERLNPKAAATRDNVTSFLINFDSPAKIGDVSFKPAAGRFGQGIEFPAPFMIPAPKGKPILDSNQGTIELFLKVTDDKWFASTRNILSCDAGWGKPGTMSLWYWVLKGKGRLRFDNHSFGKNRGAYVTCPMPRDNKWHHIAATWDNKRGISLYVDGVRRGHYEWAFAGDYIPEAKRQLKFGAKNHGGMSLVDEVRVSTAMRLGPDETSVIHKVKTGPAIVKNGKTMMPISVELYNRDIVETKLAGTISVVDYYQTSLASKAIATVLKAGERKIVAFEIPAEGAGKYVKAVVDLSEGAGKSSRSIKDEQVVFVDVLTGPRMQLSMNGRWDVCNGNPASIVPPKKGKWRATELPKIDYTWRSTHTKWFRKRVVLPAAMKGKKIELHLSGVRFKVDVFLNGKRVGGGHTDRMPFIVDLTSAAKLSQENELLVAITDWISSIRPDWQRNFYKISTNHQGTGIGGNLLIRPSTGMLSPAGIMDPIFIVASSPMAVENTYITPSIRKRNLVAKTIVRNPNSKSRKVVLRYSVMDGNKPVLDGGRKVVTLQPGLNVINHVIPVTPNSLKMWWPKKPKLYRMRIELTDGSKLQDRFDARFGYREFWCDGPVFRINGIATKPGVAAGWPRDFPMGGCKTKVWYGVKRYLESFFNINVTLVRYHAEPFPIMMFDIADEVGLMVISEAIMSTIPLKQKFSDKRFWEACATYYPKWVLREFNHPSLVIRSIENEGGYLLPPKGPSAVVGDEAAVQMTIREFRRMGRITKKTDPSRPIMYDGSGPVFYNVADIYNAHYPGTAGMGKTYPIATRWTTFPLQSFSIKDWFWDRKKPLYIGEAYPLLGSTPSSLAGLVGDEAFVGEYAYAGAAVMWAQAIEGHRIAGVTAMYPWTPLYPASRPVITPTSTPLIEIYARLIKPIATFIHQYRSCYFANSKIVRTLTTLNDTLETQDITVKWRLATTGGKALRSGEFKTKLEPAGMKRTNVPVVLPNVAKPTAGKFIVDTFTGGKLQFSAEKPIEIFPETLAKLKLTANYGAIGLNMEPFKRLGVKVRKLDVCKLDLKGIDVLLISGDITKLPGQEKEIDRFCSEGGRIVVFGGKSTPEYLPVKLEVTEATSTIMLPDDADPTVLHKIDTLGSCTTMAFPRYPDHPVLKGIGKQHLRHWRENFLLADHTFKKPEDFTAKAIVDCAGGFKEAVVLEIPHGRGVIMAVQLPVVSMFDQQPVARKVLANLLEYVDTCGSLAPKPIGLLADRKGKVFRFLKAIGVEPWNLSGRLDDIANLSAYSLIMVNCDRESLDELARHKDKFDKFVRAGGVVWLHKPAPEHAQLLSKLVGADVKINPLFLKRPVKLAKRGLGLGVTGDSVYWRRSGWVYFQNPPAPRIAKHTVDIAPGDGIEKLVTPAIFASVRRGKGHWFIDQVTWEGEYNQAKQARAFVRPILANVPTVQIRKKAEKAADVSHLGFKSIDISRSCNASFVGGVWNAPQAGLHGLPLGKNVFKGIEYKIVDPKSNSGKSCVGFYSNKYNLKGARKVLLPVRRKAAQVNLLITSLWTNLLQPNDPVLEYDVKYVDGSHVKGHVLYGKDVQDWCRISRTPDDYHPGMAWKGKKSPFPGLYNFAFKNPYPRVAIESVTLDSGDRVSLLILIAASTQDRLPEKAKPVFVIPGMEE